MTIPQISVFLENKAGQLADITGILSQNQVNMRAINIAETTDYGVLRLIVDDAAKASSILLEQGFILTMTPVVGVAVPDTPGGLSKVLSVISCAEIDVEYMYSVFGQKDGLYDFPRGGCGWADGSSYEERDQYHCGRRSGTSLINQRNG